MASTDRAKRNKGISLFLVDGGTPGITLGPNIPRMGVVGGETGSVALEDVFVPQDALLGEEGKEKLGATALPGSSPWSAYRDARLFEIFRGTSEPCG